MTCPCGCPRPVKPGRTYATAGCAGRCHLPRPTVDQNRRARRIGVQKRQDRLFAAVIDRHVRHGVITRAAIFAIAVEAYRIGSASQSNRRYRRRQAGKAAA